MPIITIINLQRGKHHRHQEAHQEAIIITSDYNDKQPSLGLRRWNGEGIANVEIKTEKKQHERKASSAHHFLMSFVVVLKQLDATKIPEHIIEKHSMVFRSVHISLRRMPICHEVPLS